MESPEQIPKTLAEQIFNCKDKETLLAILHGGSLLSPDVLKTVESLFSDSEDRFDNLPIKLRGIPEADELRAKVIDLLVRDELAKIDSPQLLIDFLKEAERFFGVTVVPSSAKGEEGHQLAMVVNAVVSYFAGTSNGLLPRAWGIRETAERLTQQR